MSQLMALLKANPVSKENEEVYFTTRYTNEDGSPVMASVRPMKSKEYYGYKKKATNIMKKGKVDYDQDAFYKQIVINHTVEPNFRDAKEIAEAGVTTPEQFVDLFLLAGEVEALAEGIIEISGFGESIDELKEQVKN